MLRRIQMDVRTLPSIIWGLLLTECLLPSVIIFTAAAPITCPLPSLCDGYGANNPVFNLTGQTTSALLRVLRVNSWARSSGCTPTAVYSPPSTECTCAREGSCHVPGACLGLGPQRSADHRPRLFSVPSAQTSGHKASPYSSLWFSRVGFFCCVIVLAQIRVCFVCFFHPPPSVSHGTGRPLLMGTDESVMLSCWAEWCMSGALDYSLDMCFLVTTASAQPQRDLIYSWAVKGIP